MKKTDKSSAIASLIFGLFFWLPLLNMITSAAAIYLGIRAILMAKKDPDHYGGQIIALIGIVLGTVPIALYILGLIEYLFFGVPMPKI